MLVKKDLDKMSDGQLFETVALIKGYDVKPTKTGGKFIGGCLEIKGSVDFKVWAGSLLDDMEKYDYSDTICKISGKVNEYNGLKSLVLNDIKALDEGTYDQSDFFEDKYDVEAYWNGLVNLIKKNSSLESFEIFSEVMSYEGLSKRFKVEFAARGHHDAVKTGLLAHTYKVTYIMSRVLKLYPTICSTLDTDVLVLGSALHDIGKVYEYTNGVIKDNGLLVSHHTFGVEILSKYKEFIISKKSEEFYYRLLAIIEQHHGEFEETPRTIEAMIVHLVDNIESRMQIINETYERGLGVVSLGEYKLN